MTCTNAACAIFVVCQNKDRPCPANTPRTVIVHNGYAAMAMQEYHLRDSAIDYSGDWSVP
jgi:hypothetical protein